MVVSDLRKTEFGHTQISVPKISIPVSKTVCNILPFEVTLNIPPFKRGRDQLNLEETDETARITAVRIHVERAIGQIKKYHILDGNCLLSMTPLMKHIFTVCSYLTNSLPPLVPRTEANTG